MDQRPVDLTELLRNNHYQLRAAESEEDARVRRERELEDSRHKRRLELLLFIFCLAITGAVFAASLYLALTGTGEDKKWATATVSAITAGVLGYLVGRKS